MQLEFFIFGSKIILLIQFQCYLYIYFLLLFGQNQKPIVILKIKMQRHLWHTTLIIKLCIQNIIYIILFNISTFEPMVVFIQIKLLITTYITLLCKDSIIIWKIKTEHLIFNFYYFLMLFPIFALLSPSPCLYAYLITIGYEASLHFVIFILKNWEKSSK